MGNVFELGDRVRATKTCSGAITGEEYVVVRASHGELVAGGCTCVESWVKVKGKGGSMTKRVWEVIVVDKVKDKIIIKEVVIDGDEKAVCSKISIANAAKLKEIAFEDLAYIAKELGSYESKEKKD